MGFKQWLKEASKMGDVSKRISVQIDLPVIGSAHATDRRFRHENGEISESEITQTVEKALDRMAEALVEGDLKLDQSICIKDRNTGLAIIGVLEERNRHNRFKVITVMRKPSFRAKHGDFLIFV